MNTDGTVDYIEIWRCNSWLWAMSLLW